MILWILEEYNMNMNIGRVGLLIISVLFLFGTASCGRLGNVNADSNNPYLENLQKAVPYTIVVPTYFPDNISFTLVSIGGPDPGVHSKTSVAFSLTYKEKGENNIITIDEENYESDPIPSDPLSPRIDISGVKVVEEDTKLPYPDSSHQLDGISYVWSHNGITFMVQIFGFQRDESRKVIESMIK